MEFKFQFRFHKNTYIRNNQNAQRQWSWDTIKHAQIEILSKYEDRL